jgi:hypothetical protein
MLGLMSDASNELEAPLFFSHFDVLKNSVQIVVEAGAMGVTHLANLVDDWISHGSDSGRGTLALPAAPVGGFLRRLLVQLSSQFLEE